MKILIIDDNLDTINLYSEAIFHRLATVESKLGKHAMSNGKEYLEVDGAYSVSNALSKLQSGRYDLLIVDLKIPGTSGEEMGGLEVIRESLRMDPLLPIIVITGYGTIQLARETLTQGVFDFIEKSTTAVDDLINSVKNAIISRKEKLFRSGNPFSPMTGVEPSVFGGRTNELEFFEQRLERALRGNQFEHFLVLGNWGIGKSTLLKEFKKLCQSRGNIASLVLLEPFQSGTKLIDVARSLIESILRDLPFSIDRFKGILNYFDSIGISVLGTGIQMGRNATKIDLSPQSFLFDSLKNVWKDLKDNSDVFVILLDDLDNYAIVPEFLMTLKQTLSLDSIRSSRILVGISSTQTNWHEITKVKKYQPLSRYFLHRIELGPLSERELRETVIRSLSGTSISFSQEVISKVYEYTKGHPFEMQVLCRNLFNNQLMHHVTLDLWEKALMSTIDDLGVAVFEHWYNRVNPGEARVLRAIVECETDVSVREIHEFFTESMVKIAEKSIEKYLQRLIDKQLVARATHERYFIPDVMFRTYLRYKKTL